MRLGEYRFVGVIPPHLTKHIIIRHPGYIRGEDSMLLLPRLDIVDHKDKTDKGPETLCGVHFGTVISACAIIAGNSFGRAFLSYDREGDRKVHLSHNGILTWEYYYLHVPQDGTDDTTSYPVTPNFQNWRFPKKVPNPWMTYASTLLSKDGCCIVSGSRIVELAHVIPEAHELWWTNNAMGDYASGSASLSKGNTVPLRVDLRMVFNDCAFALVPKADPQGWLHLTAHFLSIQDYGDVALEFHNQKAHSLDAVPAPFLFARFALAVFTCVENFVLSGETRKIAVVERGTDAKGRPIWKTKVADMDRAQRQALFGRGESRGSGPSQRSRDSGPSQKSPAGGDNDNNEQDDMDSDCNDDDYLDIDDQHGHKDRNKDNDSRHGYGSYDDYDDDERRRHEVAQLRVESWLSSGEAAEGGQDEACRPAKRRRTSEDSSSVRSRTFLGDDRSDITSFCPYDPDME